MPDDPLTEPAADLERPLDAQSVREIVADRVAPQLDELGRAIEAIAARMRAGGRLIYLGAGTSGRLAQVDAIECVPTFNLPEGTVMAIVAGGRGRWRSSLARFSRGGRVRAEVKENLIRRLVG